MKFAEAFVDRDVILIGGEMVNSKMSSHIKVVQDSLSHVRLNQSPEVFSLFGKEGRVDFNFLVYSEANSDANVLIVISQEYWVGNIEIMDFFDSLIADVKLRCLFYNITSGFFFQIFKQNRVNSVIL